MGRLSRYVLFRRGGAQLNDMRDGHQHRLTPDMASFRLLVLAFVREYLAEHRASPSYGEVAASLGSSRERVRKAVRSLDREGLLLRTPGPRGLSLPTLRDEAIRQLRELGWAIDEDLQRAAEPVTLPPLLPPIELDYPSADGDHEKAA